MTRAAVMASRAVSMELSADRRNGQIVGNQEQSCELARHRDRMLPNETVYRGLSNCRRHPPTVRDENSITVCLSPVKRYQCATTSLRQLPVCEPVTSLRRPLGRSRFAGSVECGGSTPLWLILFQHITTSSHPEDVCSCKLAGPDRPRLPLFPAGRQAPSVARPEFAVPVSRPFGREGLPGDIRPR